MSQNIRAVAGLGVPPRQHLEGRWIGMGHHVGLVDPGEAFDGRAVEAHPLGERPLELGRRDRDRLQEAENVGEPHPDEPDVSLLDGPQHELGLLVHPAKSAVQDVTAELRARQANFLDCSRIRRSQSIVGVLSRYAHPLVAS